MVQTSIGKARTPVNIPISLVLNHLFIKRHGLSLFHRAFKICSTQKLFDQQVGKIKTFMAWNGFHTRVSKML